MNVQNIGKRLISSTSLALSLLCFAHAVHAQTCPPVGAVTDCGIIITITDKGTTLKNTGQGPYDGSDDSLVGVFASRTGEVR